MIFHPDFSDFIESEGNILENFPSEQIKNDCMQKVEFVI